MASGLLAGKNIAVLGIANRRSIAYAIAQAMADQGANLALSFQGERLKETVEEFGADLGAKVIAPCDVSDDTSTEQFFSAVQSGMGSLDCLVHSIAFVPGEELKGRYIDTSRDGSRIAHEVSADSFRLLARFAEPLLNEGGSLMTLTYLGSSYAFPHYNVMGPAKASLEATVRYLAYDLGPKKIRVNAISAPPLRTLAARSIPGFNDMLKSYEEKSPLGILNAEDVAGVAVFLASDLSRSITAETIIADGGYSRMGL